MSEPAIEPEEAAWAWLDVTFPAPTDQDYSADEMVDAFLAGVERAASLRSPTMPTEERVMRAREVLREGFAPCPTCHQYSHSIGEGQLHDAFMHFQSMFSHRGDGIPTQCSFDAKTRDAAQVLMAAAFADEGSGIGELREAASLVFRIEAAGAIDYEAENFERWKAIAREIAPRLRAALSCSPDIDRSGLAQEVE